MKFRLILMIAAVFAGGSLLPPSADASCAGCGPGFVCMMPEEGGFYVRDPSMFLKPQRIMRPSPDMLGAVMESKLDMLASESPMWPTFQNRPGSFEKMVGAAAAFQAPQLSKEKLARTLYVLDAVIQRWKVKCAKEYVQAALEAGDVEAALDLSRDLPTRNCPLGWESAGVVHSPCPRVEVMYLIASSPVAAGRVDWHRETEKLNIPEYEKPRLLTSLAVKQARGGHIDSAIVTARSHLRGGDWSDALEAISAQAAVAVAVADRGDFARALKIAKNAHGECGGSWCKRESDSGYREDLEWAFARIAWAQAENGDADGAVVTVRLGDELVGGRGDWLDKARRQVALEHARKRRPFKAVYATEAIRRDDWRKDIKGKVEAMFAERM